MGQHRSPDAATLSSWMDHEKIEPIAVGKDSDRNYFAKFRDARVHNAGIIGRRGSNVISGSVLT